MGDRTTHTGYLRQRGATSSSSSKLNGPSAGVVPAVVHFQIPAAFGLAGGILSGKFLPKGAVVLKTDVLPLSLSGATTPALDIGLEAATPDDDGLVAQVAIVNPSTTNLGSTEAGLLTGEPLPEDAEITYSDASATQATAGTLDIWVWYTFDDDGSLNN